ncbi:hypothetical protein ANN_21463 [Periplaneta americana]|uniref:Uncharacterized protein n=1 Tax=Periplaneta americana TaxID=6978 RepID=A0ABQ8SFC7_PERAM|nr:hypothetical protein ANN_21463 [Periplaneta americana]
MSERERMYIRTPSLNAQASIKEVTNTRRWELRGEEEYWWLRMQTAERAFPFFSDYIIAIHCFTNTDNFVCSNVLKRRRLRWTGHVARTGETRNVYKMLVGRPEGKRPFGRPRCRKEDNIKMDLREVGYDGRVWITLLRTGTDGGLCEGGNEPLGSSKAVLLAGQGLNDNQWHTLRFSRRASSLKLQVDDDGPSRADAVFGKQNVLEFRTMHVGGLFHAEEEIQMTNTVPNFVGSMQQFSFNGHLYFEMARSSGGGYGGQHSPGSAPQLRVTAKFGKRDHQLVHHPVTFRSKHTFVGLPVLKAYSATNIYFQFKTREPSGLIMYNAGREQDFLAVELVNGHLHYIFNLGDGPVRVRDNARSSLNDNRWHAVTIGRPSPKQHTLMVDDNFAIVTSLGTNENLDLAGILYLGGVRKDMYSLLPKQIQSRQGYEGCLASLDLNGESPNLMVDAVVPSSQLAAGCEDGTSAQYPSGEYFGNRNELTLVLFLLFSSICYISYTYFIYYITHHVTNFTHFKFLEDENKLLRREKENGEEREEKKKHGAASVIIGDSIIRHVGNLHSELATECYPGIRVNEMKSVIENQERGDPKNIVLHVGTNDLRRGVDYIMADVYDLVMETKKKYPAAGIVISGIVRRRDVNWRKVGRVNKAFEWVAECLGARFVDPNSWIDDRCFGRDGIHLNRRGAADMGSLFARVVTTTWRGGIEDPSAGSGTEGPSADGGGVGLPAIRNGLETLDVIACYRPPSELNNLTLHKLNEYLNTVSEDRNVVIAGDLNLPKINWNGISGTNSDAQTLVNELIWRKDFTQVVNGPTRDNALLDVYLLRPVSLFVNSESLHKISDHNSVLLEILWENTVNPRSSPVSVWNFNKTDVHELQTFLRQKHDDFLRTEGNMENVWHKFKCIIFEALVKCVPSKIIKKNPDPEYYTNYIRYLKKKTRRAFSKRKRSHDHWEKYVELIKKLECEKAIPCDWKSAIVVPIHKGGNKLDVGNYRPISLTSVVCKVMEHLISDYIRHVLNAKDWFYNRQHGFREGFSCDSQITSLVQDLAEEVDRGGRIDAVVIDFSKAFDLVPHDILIDKLSRLGIDKRVVLWIQEFLKDDCIIYRKIRNNSDVDAIQTDLNKIYNWALKHRMKINGSKSKSITFCKTREETTLNYEFSGVVIPQEQCCKYLGVYLNSKLSWGEHVDNVTGKAWRALHFIMRILRKASPKSREIAYLTLVRPLMEYGTTCWDPYRIYQINSLERIQYRAAKFVKGKREDGNDTIKELKWETLENRRRKTRITSLYRAHLGQKAWVDITARLEKPTYYGRNDHDFKIKCRKQKTDVGPSTKCSHNICANRGVCVQQWNSYACDCDMTSYTGPTCSDESVAYEFGPGRGLITFTYPEGKRPEMKSDVIALGFITSKEDAVLLRIDSGRSNDYMELEIVTEEENTSLPFRQTVWFRYTKDASCTVQIKTGCEDSYFERFTFKQRRGRPLKSEPVKPYCARLCICDAKWKDLQKLCNDLQIPKAYHGLYESLPSSATVRDALAEPNISEESDQE